MTQADALKRLVHRVRAIPGRMGLRPFRVYVVTRTSSDIPAGEGGYSDSETEIAESGQPPKVRSVKGEEIAINNLDSGSIRIGPITPEHTGGGFDLDTLQSTMTAEQERFIKVVGPGRENGVLFRITDINLDHAMHYTIVAAPLAKSP
jgi:hypothetical protein